MNTAPPINKLPETLKHIFDRLEALFTEKGIQSPAKLALDTCMILSIDFGGLQVYIPKSESALLHMRNLEIFSKAGKVKASTLAIEYGISTVQVHSIINKLRKENSQPM